MASSSISKFIDEACRGDLIEFLGKDPSVGFDGGETRAVPICRFRT